MTGRLGGRRCVVVERRPWWLLDVYDMSVCHGNVNGGKCCRSVVSTIIIAVKVEKKFVGSSPMTCLIYMRVFFKKLRALWAETGPLVFLCRVSRVTYGGIYIF